MINYDTYSMNMSSPIYVYTREIYHICKSDKNNFRLSPDHTQVEWVLRYHANNMKKANRHV